MSRESEVKKFLSMVYHSGFNQGRNSVVFDSEHSSKVVDSAYYLIEGWLE